MRRWLPAVLLALASCSKSPTGARIAPEFAPLLPSDTLHLVGVRTEEIRTSPLYKLATTGRQNAGLQRFVEETGVDPARDVEELLAANNGASTLLLIRGKLPRQAIEAKLAQRGLTRTQHAGAALYEGEGYAVALIGDGLAAAGPSAMVRTAAEKKGSPIPEKLAALVKSVPAGHDVWAVSLGKLPELELPQGGNFGNLQRAFAAIDTAVASADLSSGLKLAVTANYAAEADAKQVHGAARGMIGLGRLMTPPDKPEMLRFLDAFQVVQEGRLLRINADVPADLLVKVAGQLESLGNR